MNEFWFWVAMLPVTITIGKVTGKTVSKWIQGFFGQTIDYAIMIILVVVQVLLYVHEILPLPDIENWQTIAAPIIRNVVLGHWFWHEDKGGTITRGWIIEKIKGLFD